MNYLCVSLIKYLRPPRLRLKSGPEESLFEGLVSPHTSPLTLRLYDDWDTLEGYSQGVYLGATTKTSQCLSWDIGSVFYLMILFQFIIHFHIHTHTSKYICIGTQKGVSRSFSLYDS